MSLVLGIAGAARNASVALCDHGRLVAVCEQERVTRTRRDGLRAGQLPKEAVDTVLGVGGRTLANIGSYATAEAAIQLPPELKVERLDHHYGHAATSFLTSAFDAALIVVCDRRGVPDMTVWRGEHTTITPADFAWNGPGLATLYSQATGSAGFAEGDEYRFEALARIASDEAASGGWHAQDDGVAGRARVAADVQRHFGNLLVQLLAEVKNRYGSRNLCLAGGLFYNSYFNTRAAQSGLYEHVFVPINPGNAGVSVGAALAVSGQLGFKRDQHVPPFLGPEYDTGEIKSTLDNCKLSYDYLRDGAVIDQTAAAIASGKLVGWFQGRMEWGPRALGNRSILANPRAPYVLENLNVFLKHREPHRSYSVSVCAEDAARYFRGPAASDHMEYEYEVVDPSLVHPLLPTGATRLRVHTVPKSAGIFHTLIKAVGDRTGIPILVNTSFNGFNEPIVCTPRDAVRVFYGTGLDLAVLGSFVLRK